MRNLCRIYFRDVATLRSFYWVELAEDQSIYFGTSNSNHFKTGHAGTSIAELGGMHILPDVDGRPMSPTELKTKHSIHGSGIVNLPTQTAAMRDRYEIKPPRNGFDSLPIVGVLPMSPERYPVSHKTPKQTDLVFNASCCSSHPIGLLIYLKVVGLPDPPPIAFARQRVAAFAEESVRLGNFLLCLAIYSDPTQIPTWQPKEVQVMGHPSSPGEKPNWPFFA